ncbi:MAG: hypothetical protein LBV62_03050 [Rickettsiales bacterium]|jgi:hypothetical protein|nr:hypothetical protein [Rickettsiales bacterium]
MEAYEKSQSQDKFTIHSSKIKDEANIDNKHIKGVGSKFEKGNVEQVDNKKSHGP